MGDGFSRGPLPWMGSETKIGTCPTCGAPTKGDLYRNEALLERDAENSRLRARVAELEAREARLVAALEGLIHVPKEWIGNNEVTLTVSGHAIRDAHIALNEVKGGDDGNN